MERLGFGRQAVLDLVRNRDHGIIYVGRTAMAGTAPGLTVLDDSRLVMLATVSRWASVRPWAWMKL